MRLLRISVIILAAAVLAGGLVWFMTGRTGDAGGSETAGAPEPVADPALVARVSAQAVAGEVSSQRQMGQWALGQAGQPRDYRKAAEWLGKAAAAGDAEAQFLLGTLCETGRDLGGELTNARVWFERAAAQHHPGALYNLGSMHAAGRGVPQDSALAAKYFQQAAELGNALAQFNLAQRYELGRGVSTNLAESWKWYSLAAKGGVPDAVARRAGVESVLTRSELAEARRLLAEFKPATR